ncbi:MAG: hypothetical protein ACKOBM_14520, partial [Gammaproteobacteria bacterium]
LESLIWAGLRKLRAVPRLGRCCTLDYLDVAAPNGRCVIEVGADARRPAQDGPADAKIKPSR